jgi:hypothetical protein
VIIVWKTVLFAVCETEVGERSMSFTTDKIKKGGKLKEDGENGQLTLWPYKKTGI